MIGCAVLAAGAGRRFGGAKQLAPLGGQPLLRRAVAAACASACPRVAVVLGARAGTVAAAIAGLAVDRVDNHAWAEGMASSVRAAVEWAIERGCDGLLLAVADQPSLSAAHLDALIVASAGGARIAASGYRGVLGVPALFPRARYPALRALRGDTGARALLREGAWPVIEVPWEAGGADVDRGGDLNPRP
jgi:molybdenum cofactor cytidylyltransferase